MAQLGEISIAITISEDYVKGLQKVENEGQKLAKSLEKKLGGGFETAAKKIQQDFQKVGGAFTDLGGSITKLSLPLLGLGAAIIGVTEKFDAIFTGTAAIARAGGAAEGDISKLRDTILDFAGKGVFSVSEVAKAVDDMVKDGLDPATISTFQLKAAFDLAAAAGETLSQSQIALSDAMQSFGAETNQAQKFADTFANFLNITPGSLTDFQEALTPVGPTAVTLGANLEDVSAVLAILANNGIRGSEAGNSFKRVLLNLSTPTKEQAAVMKKLNLQVFDAQGNFVGIRKVFDQLITKTKNLTTEEKAYTFATLGGAFGQSTLNTVVNNGIDTFDKYREAIGNAGSAEVIAADRTKGLSATLKRLRATIETTFVKIGLDKAVGENLQKVIDKVIPFIEKLGESFINLPDGVKTAIIAIGAFIVVLGPLLVIFGTLISSIGTIAGAIGTIAGAISPAVIVIGALVAVLIALGSIVVEIAKRSGILQEIFDRIKPTIDTVVGFFKKVVEQLKELKKAFETAFEDPQVQAALQELKKVFDELKPVFDTLVSQVIELGNELGFGDVRFTTFEEKVAKAKEAIMAIINVIKFFIGVAKTVIQVVTFIVRVITGIIRVAKDVWQGIKDLATGIGQFVTDVIAWFASLPDQINAFIQQVILFIQQLPQKAYEFGFQVGQAIRTIIDFFASLPGKILEFINQAIAWIATLPERAVTFFTNLINSAILFFNNLVQTGKDKGKAFVDGVIEFIKNLPTNLQTWFNETLNKAKTFGSDFVNKVVEGIKSVGSKIGSTISGFFSGLGAGFNSKMFGGLVGFMRGGLARAQSGLLNLGKTMGTDSLLTALTPGELVLPRNTTNQLMGVLRQIVGLPNFASAKTGLSRGNTLQGMTQNFNIGNLNARNEDEGRKRAGDLGFGIHMNLLNKGLL